MAQNSKIGVMKANQSFCCGFCFEGSSRDELSTISYLTMKGCVVSACDFQTGYFRLRVFGEECHSCGPTIPIQGIRICNRIFLKTIFSYSNIFFIGRNSWNTHQNVVSWFWLARETCTVGRNIYVAPFYTIIMKGKDLRAYFPLCGHCTTLMCLWNLWWACYRMLAKEQAGLQKQTK